MLWLETFILCLASLRFASGRGGVGKCPHESTPTGGRDFRESWTSQP